MLTLSKKGRNNQDIVNRSGYYIFFIKCISTLKCDNIQAHSMQQYFSVP